MRNPSITFATLFVLVVVGVPLGIALALTFPKGIENYKEVKRLQAPDFAQAPGVWVRPWLVEKAVMMLKANEPVEWHPADFVYGPCADENMAQLPTEKFRNAIVYSCDELERIQRVYAADCASTGSCTVREQAKSDLRAVIGVLDDAFADAGFVSPALEEQQAQ